MSEQYLCVCRGGRGQGCLCVQLTGSPERVVVCGGCVSGSLCHYALLTGVLEVFPGVSDVG